MNGAPSILIIARPGNDRQSLIALLKTLGGLDLFLDDGRGGSTAAARSPDLVLFDLDRLDPSCTDALQRATRDFPAARRLALVADIRQTPAAHALGAQCALDRCTPAGDLLAAVSRMLPA
jgi:hypothetical protein